MTSPRLTRILATSAVATILTGGLVTSAGAMPLPVTSVQQIAGARPTEQVQWWGGWGGYGWGGSYYGGGYGAGALAAGAIGGLAIGALAASTSSYYGGYGGYGYGYPGYSYGYYPSYYGGSYYGGYGGYGGASDWGYGGGWLSLKGKARHGRKHGRH